MEIHNILVPTDFSAYAAYVLQQALVLAARDKAHVLLLHVLDRFEVMWPEVLRPTRIRLMQKLQAKVEQRLQTAAAAQPLPIETLAVWGNPATEICRIAREYRADLIMMSPHRRNDLARIFRDSVTEHVVHYAPCSVLILRTSQPKAVRVDQLSILRYLHQCSAETTYRDHAAGEAHGPSAHCKAAMAWRPDAVAATPEIIHVEAPGYSWATMAALQPHTAQ
jgi:nucleotide-binding universal stress UspA family protein